MKVIELWQEEKDQYILSHGFMLKRADKLEFGIHETIYSNVDLELSFSWKKQTIDKIDLWLLVRLMMPCYNGQIIITRLRYMGLLLGI